jgi:hypothetical protein
MHKPIVPTYLLLCICFIGLFTFNGCSPAATVKKRATFDLDCPESKIEVVDIGGSIWGATGCGKKASYIAACGLSCVALKEGSSEAKAVLGK